MFVGGQGTLTVYGLLSAPVSSPPAAPTNLTAAAVAPTQVNLAWANNATNQTGFVIQRSTDGVNYAQIAVTPATATTYHDTAVNPAASYSYRVLANNSAGNSPAASAGPVATPAAGGTVFLSDLGWASATNGLGPVEKDTSNGGAAAGDGQTITLNAVTYAKGLGTSANSDLVFNLNGAFASFTSDVGVDAEVSSSGSVDFQLFADGTKVFDSGTMHGGSPTQTASVNVAGVNKLELVTFDPTGPTSLDHGDWAGARLTYAAATPPAAPTGLTATAASTSAVTLAWTDNANNETGYRVLTKHRRRQLHPGRPVARQLRRLHRQRPALQHLLHLRGARHQLGRRLRHLQRRRRHDAAGHARHALGRRGHGRAVRRRSA